MKWSTLKRKIAEEMERHNVTDDEMSLTFFQVIRSNMVSVVLSGETIDIHKTIECEEDE